MESKFKKVSVVGLGYIGLPTAAVIASRGIDVIGLDVKSEVVDIINNGGIHIIEPGLDVVVQGVVSTGKLKASLKAEPADVFLIAVPTPFSEGYVPQLSYIRSAIENIAPVIKKGDLIILESTSPVGTTEKIISWMKELREDLEMPSENSLKSDVNIAYCPERVLPGHVLRELIENDRVIGGVSQLCAERATSFYKTFVEGECIATNSRTAEMVKLTENSFRDVNIAFANELSMICDDLDINPWELISLANRHPRVSILQPGPGVGGHCISVDPWFIVHKSPERAKLIKKAREVNDYKPHFVLEKVRKAIAQEEAPVVACFGLTFKPDIDDLRESPALQIATAIVSEANCPVMLVEPNIKKLPQSLDRFEGVSLVKKEEAVEKANIIVLLVDHKEFKEISENVFDDKQLIDTKGVWK